MRKNTRSNPKGKGGKGGNRKPNTKGASKKQVEEVEEKLDTSRSNNPAWYFTDERLADQVSQLAFQNVAGYPIRYDSFLQKGEVQVMEYNNLHKFSQSYNLRSSRNLYLWEG